MVQQNPKQCKYCPDMFTPHPKIGDKQTTCNKQACQRARKRENLKNLYLSDPGYNYDNVKRYRQKNPDYQKQWRQRRQAKSRLLCQEITKASRDLSSAPESPETSAGSQHQQAIANSSLVKTNKCEIQTALTSVKTNNFTDGTQLRPGSEIQTELTFCFSMALSRLIDLLPEVKKREIQIKLIG